MSIAARLNYLERARPQAFTFWFEEDGEMVCRSTGERLSVEAFRRRHGDGPVLRFNFDTPTHMED